LASERAQETDELLTEFFDRAEDDPEPRRRGQPGTESSGSLASPTHSFLLAPGARPQAGAGFVAQLTQGASAIGIVLVVHQHNGSIALAGSVAGAEAIAAGIARPVQGRLMDRHGATVMMLVCGVIHPAALCGIVGLSVLGAPAALLPALGAIGGLALPPVSTAMRVAWGEAVCTDDRAAAYSMVYLTQELSLLAGPILFSAVTAATSASLGLVAIATLSGAGTIAFAESVRLVRRRAPPAQPRRPGNVLRGRGMQSLLAAAILLGGVIGAIQVGIPALAIAHGAPASAGLLIALLSVGGVIGAVTYGARRWMSDPAARLVALMSLIAASVGLMITIPSLPVVGLLLLVAGLGVNPALTTLSLLVDRETPGPTASEAFGWLSTGIAAGTGAGSAIAGALVTHRGDARPAFVAAAVAAIIATAAAVAVGRVLGHAGRR
jgi:MFS family permease